MKIEEIETEEIETEEIEYFGINEEDEQIALEYETLEYLIDSLNRTGWPDSFETEEAQFEVDKFLQERFYEYEFGERPHLPGGLSSAGACAASQVFDVLDPQPMEKTGAFAPGTAFHEYMQEKVLPMGSDLEYGGKHYQILAHEQLVFMLHTDKNGKQKLWRKSPIDTLVWDVDAEKFEIWDWKSTRMDLQYMRKNKLRYKVQGALYSYLFAHQLNLNYYPAVRFIYANKNSWDEFKDIKFETGIKEIAESAIRKLHLVRLGRRHPDFFKKHYLEFADGLRIWSDTKKPYRQECKYCQHKSACIEYLSEFSNIHITEEQLITDKNLQQGLSIIDEIMESEPIFQSKTKTKSIKKTTNKKKISRKKTKTSTSKR